jgi:hypothetical protein
MPPLTRRRAGAAAAFDVADPLLLADLPEPPVATAAPGAIDPPPSICAVDELNSSGRSAAIRR